MQSLYPSPLEFAQKIVVKWLGPNRLNRFARSAPSDQATLDIFQGEWWSAFPGEKSGLRAGKVKLFDDERLRVLLSAVGSIKDWSVLELGPLEGGHTYCLEQAGAGKIVAVEANERLYLKCLIAKELLGMKRAQFLFGDFMKFLEHPSQEYDLCVASGVLYHMQDPVALIGRISNVAPKLFLWSHYFDGTAMAENPKHLGKFRKAELRSYEGYRHEIYTHHYGRSFLTSSRFCGGTKGTSSWMTREGILGALEYFGYSDIKILGETARDDAGPHFSVLASRWRESQSACPEPEGRRISLS